MKQGAGIAAAVAAWAALTGCEGFSTEAWENAPLADGQIEATVVSRQESFQVERVRYYSKVLKSPRFFLAIVPKSTRPPQDVLILNHGWFDRPEMLLREIKVDGVYAGLLAEKKIRPGIVVLPDVRLQRFNPQQFDRFPFPPYLTWVAEEIAGAAARKYGVPFAREHWGIGGFSYGGMVALDVGRRYGGRFGSVSVISSFWDESWSFWPSGPPTPGTVDEQGRGKNTTVIPGPPPRLLLACGEGDRFIAVMTALHDKFKANGLPHGWSTAPGGHTWEYWARVLPRILEFHLPPEAR